MIVIVSIRWNAFAFINTYIGKMVYYNCYLPQHINSLFSCMLVNMFCLKSKGGRRPRSDDVDAVTRLSVLDNPYYRDLLCELGAMFAIANRVDTVHKLPWIGFQSWRAAGRKVQISHRCQIWSYWLCQLSKNYTP